MSEPLHLHFSPFSKVPDSRGTLNGEIRADIWSKQLWGSGPSDSHHIHRGGQQGTGFGHHHTGNDTLLLEKHSPLMARFTPKYMTWFL